MQGQRVTLGWAGSAKNVKTFSGNWARCVWYGVDPIKRPFRGALVARGFPYTALRWQLLLSLNFSACSKSPIADMYDVMVRMKTFKSVLVALTAHNEYTKPAVRSTVDSIGQGHKGVLQLVA